MGQTKSKAYEPIGRRIEFDRYDGMAGPCVGCKHDLKNKQAHPCNECSRNGVAWKSSAAYRAKYGEPAHD